MLKNLQCAGFLSSLPYFYRAKVLNNYLLCDIIKRSFGTFSGDRMKYDFKFLSLILWVTQFGLSVLFPLCAMLFLALWLQQKFDLSLLVLLPFGVLGLLISVSTAKSCLRSLRRDAEEAAGEKKKVKPLSFNEHK